MSEAFLIADIGGTNSRFAVAERSGVQLDLTLRTWIPTDGVHSFGELLCTLPKFGIRLDGPAFEAVVFAVPGPVIGGERCQPTNIPWEINMGEARTAVRFLRGLLINDFMSQAFACLSPIADTATVIQRGDSAPEGTVAVLGAGTGLGKAFVVRDPVRGLFLGGPSEGGHSAFAIEHPDELEFLRFFLERKGGPHVSREDVLSGSGLSLLHEFLTGAVLDPAGVAAAFSDTAMETCRWFSRFYGRIARDFALETLATGGVFIAGGVAAKNPRVVESEEFIHSFTDSKVHAALLRRIPVRLLTDEESGLWGAAVAASALTMGTVS